MAQSAATQTRLPLSYRAAYANDQFNKTDRYYTAGFQQSIGTEVFRVGLSQALYSPTDIADSEMRMGDRPYAATAVLSVEQHFFRRDSSERWIVTGSVGLIGPRVGGQAIQGFVHRMVGVAAPEGWRYQIKNDVLLGAQLNYVRRLVRWRYFEADAGAELRAGTPFTRISIDGRASFGPQALRLRIAGSAFCPVYDATIQGGQTKRASPLSYRHSALVPAVGRIELGIEARRGRWSGFCTQVLLSRELRTGTGHAYIVCGGELRW